MKSKLIIFAMMNFFVFTSFAQENRESATYQKELSSLRKFNFSNMSKTVQLFNYSPITSKIDDDDMDRSYPKYSHFSINTGLGKSFGKSEFTSYKAPIMIFWENGGDLGKLTDFIDIPNWIFTGAYLRYSKQEVNYYNYYSYNAITLGLGIRGSVSVLPMIASISGKEMKKSGPFELYGGLQLGYDYVLYDGYLSYYGYYGSQRGLKVSPFVGGRINLLKWFGVHAELGSTSGRWCSVGINFRKKH